MSVFFCMLSACDPLVDERGHVLEEHRLSEITPGVSRQQDVRVILGAPSSLSDFGNNRWYYIRTRKESLAFFKPEIVEQQITIVEFDEGGIVSNVQTGLNELPKEIAVIKDETPTEGHSLGFFEQMLGNLGRFNAPGGN